MTTRIVSPVRRLILVAMDWTRLKDPPMSLGHASILANLIKNRIPTLAQSYSVNNEDFSSKRVVDFIMDNESHGTDVAFGAFVWNERYLKEILLNLKKYGFQGRIILGGPQISYVSKNIESYYPEADVFIRGYAEQALSDLMASNSSTPAIKGVHYSGQTDLGQSATVDLEHLESPYLINLIAPQRFLRFETQRGCPFRCSFCQHRESDAFRQRRAFSSNRIRKEIEWITKHPIIQDVAVLDPTFNSGTAYLHHLQGFIDGKFSGKLSLQVRLEMMNKEFLDSVQRLNETGRVVLEAGLQTIHKEEQRIIDRPTNLTKVKAMLQELDQRGIETAISLIFGLPGQTVQSFQESIDFCRLHAPRSTLTAFPLMLLRGTPLEARKEELGLVESSDESPLELDRQQEGISHVIASKTFNHSDWKVMATMAEELQRCAE